MRRSATGSSSTVRLADVDGVEVRAHGTTLYNSIYRFDEEMLVNPHNNRASAAHGPALHLRQLARGTLFDSYADDFDRVWAGAKRITWPEP